MPNLVDATFENIAEEYVVPLVIRLMHSESNILNIVSPEGKPFISALNFTINNKNDGVFIMNLKTLKIKTNVLFEINLRVLKYSDKYDLDFNFRESNIIIFSNFLKEFHIYMTQLAMEFNVSIYYAGMEPASDEHTRYFTCLENGPLNV